MANDVAISPGMRKALIWGVMVSVVPILGLFGWIVIQLNRPVEDCPLCDAVVTEDPTAVERALSDAATVNDRAWRMALERVDSPQDHEGPPLEIVTTLLSRGADPNYFWTGASGGTSQAGGSVTFGDVTVGSGSSRSSGRRHFAAAAVAGDTDKVQTIDLFLQKGLDVKGAPAGEALVAAARASHVNTVRRLLQAGVPVNYVASEVPRRTALAEAIQTRDLAVIAALESAGAREW